MTKDPVCGMTINEQDAAATESYQGNLYHFCSSACHAKFQTDPAQYAVKS